MNINFREDAAFLSSIDRVLKIICQKIELTPTQYGLAEMHYQAVSQWLEQEDSPLAIYKPQIYPQGSLPTGTTNKPLFKDEYDLDFICELKICSQVISPLALFMLIESRISQHDTYSAKMKKGNRCITLVYEHDFHLDIVPACHVPELGWGQVRIPDRALKTWKDTNSKQYVSWFNQRSDILSVSNRIDAASPLPKQENVEEKAALKFAVQLIKRYRSLAFKSQPDLAPASILLSTLCGMHYQGEESVAETVTGLLSRINGAIVANQSERLQVPNPANEIFEDLGERWEKIAGSYEAFTTWIQKFLHLWQDVRTSRGEDLGNLLEGLFGEQLARDALREDSAQINQLRNNDELKIQTKNGCLGVGTSNISVPRNTFYGQ